MSNAMDEIAQFLSTPSARRATHRCSVLVHVWRISIHALREEGDWAALSRLPRPLYFYPRPPRGGRRCHQRLHGREDQISIHALREEGDMSNTDVTIEQQDFYPRPPRGGRPEEQRQLYQRQADFYPRPPRGGRHFCFFGACIVLVISIHALREEGDRSCILSLRLSLYFYPRPPRGGRR